MAKYISEITDVKKEVEELYEGEQFADKISTGISYLLSILTIKITIIYCIIYDLSKKYNYNS
jgi:hypothetical protein